MEKRLECLKGYIRDLNKKRTESNKINVTWVNRTK